MSGSTDPAARRESRERSRSILDMLTDQLGRLATRLGPRDEAKLDEYLESIRDIEKRIERASREERLEGWQPSISEPNLAR